MRLISGLSQLSFCPKNPQLCGVIMIILLLPVKSVCVYVCVYVSVSGGLLFLSQWDVTCGSLSMWSDQFLEFSQPHCSALLLSAEPQPETLTTCLILVINILLARLRAKSIEIKLCTKLGET